MVPVTSRHAPDLSRNNAGSDNSNLNPRAVALYIGLPMLTQFALNVGLKSRGVLGVGARFE